jgi:hypothetical protein
MMITGRMLARALVILAVGCVAGSALGEVSPKSSGDGDEYVWHWTSRCDSPEQITVVLTVDDRAVNKSIIPLCLVMRAGLRSRDSKTMHTFVLRKLTRSVFGEHPGARIEIGIWEAGNESGAIVLGVSASEKDQILPNTLHSANPDAEAESRLARGLLIRTFPAPNRERPSSSIANYNN